MFRHSHEGKGGRKVAGITAAVLAAGALALSSGCDVAPAAENPPAAQQEDKNQINTCPAGWNQNMHPLTESPAALGAQVNEATAGLLAKMHYVDSRGYLAEKMVTVNGRIVQILPEPDAKLRYAADEVFPKERKYDKEYFQADRGTNIDNTGEQVCSVEGQGLYASPKLAEVTGALRGAGVEVPELEAQIR